MIINNYRKSDKTFYESLLAGMEDTENYKTKEIFSEAVQKYMDFHDIETNNKLHSLDEAEQNAFLVSLTNKLYRLMISKVDEIEYGDIPNTKGDITKLPKYKDIRKTLEVLRTIFKQYRENEKPILEIENALSYVESYQDIFMSCYAGKIELGIMIYNNICLAIIASISYMISVCIEYIKSTKNDGMEVVLKKNKISKVKESLLYESLVKFNDSSRKGDIENALRPLIKSKVKNLAAIAPILFGIVSVIGLILGCISMLKDIVYFFYAARLRISQYFDVQAGLLEMNAQMLKDSDAETVGDKNRVIGRQLAIAARFHKIADAIAIDSNNAEKNATSDIKNDNKKYKMDDVDNNDDDGALF